MDDLDLNEQLDINKHRQEIIDALLLLHDYSDLVLTIKTISPDAKNELIERFGINTFQATAIMRIKKPINQIPKANIIEEKKNLEKIETELKSIRP